MPESTIVKKWESMLENELSFQGSQTFLLCLLAFCFFSKDLSCVTQSCFHTTPRHWCRRRLCENPECIGDPWGPLDKRTSTDLSFPPNEDGWPHPPLLYLTVWGVWVFPPRLDQHHPIMASSPICHQTNILIMQLHQWRSSRGKQTKGGLRVKVAEKPILRPGELKRAQDRHEERESGFLHGGTVSVFHISTLMGVLH